MEAARLVGLGEVEWGNAPDPSLDGQAGVIIRTVNATICGSDLHNVFAGTSLETFPARWGYPGHESVGEVIESSMPGAEPGRLVLAVPDLSCSAAFAELQAVPARFVLPIDRTEHRYDLVLAQQLGTVIWAMKRFWPAPGPVNPADATATVIGAGMAGLFFVALLAEAEFGQIIVSDPHPDRLQKATALGATETVVAEGDVIVDRTLAATGGLGADLVVEAAGEDTTRAQSVEAVREDGRVGFFGTPGSLGLAPFAFNTLFRKKATTECSHSAQHEPGLASFAAAVDMIASERLDVSGLITDRVEPSEVAKALNLAHHPSGGSLKIALSFE